MTVVAKWLVKEVERLQQDPVFVTQGILLGIAEELCEVRNNQGIMDEEIAARLGWKKGKLWKVWKCDHDITIEDLVAVAMALGHTLNVTLTPYNPTVEAMEG